VHVTACDWHFKTHNVSRTRSTFDIEGIGVNN